MAAGKADQRMEEIFSQKLNSDNNFSDFLDPRSTSKNFEKIICPYCFHENFIPIGTCSFCEKCHQKIGSCDD